MAEPSAPSDASETLPLSIRPVDDRRSFTLSATLEEEDNLLYDLQVTKTHENVVDYIYKHQLQVRDLITHHLGLGNRSRCLPVAKVIRGQFNQCMKFKVKSENDSATHFMLRCPISHRHGPDASACSTIEEKMRAEVATYAYIEENCPDIPVVHLAAFRLPSGKQFTHQTHLPWFSRCVFNIRRWLHFLRHGRKPSQYAQTAFPSTFDLPYMLLEHVEDAECLSLSYDWKSEKREDVPRVKNLYRDLSRIMISLARCPMPKIGSLCFNDDGTVCLGTRPLFAANTLLERTGAPRVLHRLYGNSTSFIHDFIKFREGVFRHQPNAALSEDDCTDQMGCLSLLRTMMPEYVDTTYEGPFVLQFTDLNVGNIFVDKHWNIVKIIDLEFVAALPPSMLEVPYWTFTTHVDERSPHMDKIREAFLQIFEQEERKLLHQDKTPRADAIRASQDSGAVWFHHCLIDRNAYTQVMREYVFPQFGFDLSSKEETKFLAQISHFMQPNSRDLVRRKLAEKEQYDRDVRACFKDTQRV